MSSFANIHNHNTADVIVIGAGISGLVATDRLQANGISVVVLDKGRGVGGRLATRRIGNGVFDLGAQYFTTRSSQFRTMVNAWTNAGITRAWATGFALPDGTIKLDHETRYCAVSGMTAIPNHMAKGLDIRLKLKVIRVQVEGNNWVVIAEDGERFSSNALLLTSPVPQSLQLLADGSVTLPKKASRQNPVGFGIFD